MIAIFVVVDLLLIYILFESVLIPLVFLIGIWGGSRRIEASLYLFLYTLLGSLFWLLAILNLWISTGTTDLNLLYLIPIEPQSQILIWFGFFLSVSVKLPLVPTHLWLIRAHVDAPLAGSMILAGIAIKLGLFVALRLMIPILPEASNQFAPLVYTFCVISILYTSLATLRQINMKSVIAYASIGHMAVCVLGAFSNTIQGIEGSILLGVAHGCGSPALFICASLLYDRYSTLILKYYRGVAQYLPFYSIIFFIFCLANMAIPLTGNFLGEFLSLSGSFFRNPLITCLAGSTMVATAAYTIWFYNRVCWGSFSPYLVYHGDLTRRELYLLAPFVLVALMLGISPNLVLDCLHLSVSKLILVEV
jgi:NADH-ubiquinone oxidoreductase chain 4